MTAPSDHPQLAVRRIAGRGPTIVFLPGYASDMTGAKALALEGWARTRGRSFVRFDYAGCGDSAGDFADQTLTSWYDDVRWLLAEERGPAVLVGSSMGGWLALLMARDHPPQVAALIGIAAAADFTDWGFSDAERAALASKGRIARGATDAPMLFTDAFHRSGAAFRLLDGPIAIDVPVRLLHGQRDMAVPWANSVAIAGLLRSPDVQTILVKDGDHRLSRPADLALLMRVTEALMTGLDLLP